MLSRWGDLAEEVLALYPPEQVAESFPELFSDELTWQMRLLGERQADTGNQAYAYYFAYTPPVDPGIPSLGAAHAAEIPYVFNNLGQLPLYPDNSSPELAAASGSGQALAELMSSYWVNFASRGDPNGDGLPEWPAFHSLLDSPRHDPVGAYGPGSRDPHRRIHPVQRPLRAPDRVVGGELRLPASLAEVEW